MTTNNNQPPDMLENDLPEDGELTLEELEQIIGGQSGGLDFSSTPNLGVEKKLFEGDVMMVQPKIDSSYSSYFGTNGTSGNEVTSNMKHIPLNLTAAFP